MKRRRAAFLVLLWGVSTWVATPARACGHLDDGSDRPRIGLVLSGGGAKGMAHVGVLQVLEELGVPVDCIAGTSMGAVVGGLYASGMTADEIVEILRGADWERMFRDSVDRELASFRRKQDDRRFQIQGRIRLGEKGLQAPLGVLEARRLERLLSFLTLPVAEVEDFDRLPIAFRAVATDVVTGERVVLASGNLPLALRASMAVPGVFEPVEYDGRLLVDGGPAENLPVSVAREMGADVVIAVLVSSRLADREDLQSPLAVTNQVIDILLRKNVQEQVRSLTDRDVLLEPDMKEAGSTQFTQVDELIPRGREAAEQAQSRLSRLALSPASYRAWRDRRRVPRWEEPPTVDEVRVAAESRPVREKMAERLSRHGGSPLDRDALDRDLEAVYGLDAVEAVEFRLVDEDGRTILEVEADERDDRLHYLRFGLELRDDFDGDTSFELGARLVSLGWNRWGTELRGDFVLGERQRFLAELHQPLAGSRFFIAPRLGYEEDTLRAGAGDGVLAELRVGTYSLGVDVGSDLGRWGELRLGVETLEGSSDVRVGDPLFPRFEPDRTRARALLSFDTLDTPGFPTWGLLGRARASTTLGGADATLLGLDVQGFWTLGKSVVHLGFLADTDLENELDGFPLSLGGFLRLSGLEQGELLGAHRALGRVVVYRQLPFLPNLVPLYAGASLEAGNVWLFEDDVALDSLVPAGSLFLGVDSPLGPLVFGLGFAEGGGESVVLRLGPVF